MTHYEKLATMIFRIIGVFFLIISVLLLIISAIFVLLGFLDPFMFRLAGNVLFLLIYIVPMIIVGFFIYANSPKLARKVCSNLDKLNE